MNKLFACAQLVLFFLLLSSSVKAADSLSLSSHYSITQTISEDISYFGEDMASYFLAPLHFNGNDWLITGGIVGGTAGLMSADTWGQQQAQSAPHSEFFQNFMNGSRKYGEIIIAGGVTGAAYIGGIVFENHWLRTTGRELVEALAYSGITTTAIKFALARARPYVRQGAHEFLPFDIANGHNSLPSGHTTVAFALSTVLSEQIHNFWASALLYGAASCTGFSRMYHNQHWLSDVFLGAAIGTTAGLFVVHHNEERENPLHKNTAELSISPTMTGIQAQYRF
jgi:hypothetical protein